jgi:hypothetical protein
MSYFLLLSKFVEPVTYGEVEKNKNRKKKGKKSNG